MKIRNIYIEDVEGDKENSVMYLTEVEYDTKDLPLQNVKFLFRYDGENFYCNEISFKSIEEFEVYQYALKRTYSYVLNKNNQYPLIDGDLVFGIDQSHNPFYGEILYIEEDKAKIRLIKHKYLSEKVKNICIKVPLENIVNISNKNGLKKIKDNRKEDLELKIIFNRYDKDLQFAQEQYDSLSKKIEKITFDIKQLESKENSPAREKAINQLNKSKVRISKKLSIHSSTIDRCNNEIEHIKKDEYFTNLINEFLL